MLEFQIKLNQKAVSVWCVPPVEVFTCVGTGVDGRVQADTLQVVMAALFVLLQRRALFVTPSTVVTLVRFSHYNVEKENVKRVGTILCNK